MRVLICDSEAHLTRMAELVAARQGHEVVGVASTCHAAERLIWSTQPEVVVLDPVIGFGTDYDLIAEASAAGARVVLFSRAARELSMERYQHAPIIVDKPDIDELEEALRTIEPLPSGRPEGERRRRPAKSGGGRNQLASAGSAAFFETMSSAEAGDALIWIDLNGGAVGDPDQVQQMVSAAAREGDRLVVSSNAIRGVLPAAGDEGVASFFARLQDQHLLTPGAAHHAVVILTREHPNDAFDRLRRAVKG